MLSCNDNDVKYEWDVSTDFQNMVQLFGQSVMPCLGIMSGNTALTTHLPLLDPVCKHN